MSHYWNRAVGYNNGLDETEHPWQFHENDYDDGENKTTALHGPKDWIVKYPTNDPDSGKILGFRCLQDDIPRNILAEKCETTFEEIPETTELGSSGRRRRGEARIQQVLGQCNHIASMKGMSVSEIREKLHADEQEFLQQHRLNNAECGPVYYFVNPPPMKETGREKGTKGNIYKNQSPHSQMSTKEELYESSVSSEDDYSHEFIPTLPKCCEIPDAVTPDAIRSFSRGISSPTDFEEDDANINHFFDIVAKMHEKCEKVNAEVANSTMHF